jgi:tetratricopeptide (TPR) repeat protein
MANAVDFSRVFAPLDLLLQARRGPAAYYVPLLRSGDEIVRFGAFCQALSLGVLPPERGEDAIALASNLAIKQRAFEFFKSRLDYEAAERVARTVVADTDSELSHAMLAQLDLNQSGILAGAVARYRSTGSINDLMRAGRAAEGEGGWLPAIDWLVRAAAIAPLDPAPFYELYVVLTRANQFDAADRLGRSLGKAGLHPYLVGVFTAAAKLGRSDAKGAARDLAAMAPPREMSSPSIKSARGYALQTLGNALDQLGQFKEAHSAFVEMNKHDLSVDVDPKQAIETAKSLAAIDVPPLPAARSDVLIMLGFPRSGTTLLEVALGSHPSIESFEEPTALDVAIAQMTAARRSGRGSDIFVGTQERYYAELERLRRKPEATLLIDKYPLRGLLAKFVAKLLPEQRYVFCTRHPFDVVLSCFRQWFMANPGMENFREWKTALAFYDFVMTQWFETHSLDDPNVHYVRYDDLVTGFEPTIRGILDFAGTAWDDRVSSFADAANERAAMTPSYQKVRRGLSMGVQTYWQNYRFLFDGPDGAPLRHWAGHFGYSVE